MECPVMKVKDENEQGFKLINVEDFDEAIHAVFTEAEVVVAAASEPAAGAATAKPAWTTKKPK